MGWLAPRAPVEPCKAVDEVSLLVAVLERMTEKLGVTVAVSTGELPDKGPVDVTWVDVGVNVDCGSCTVDVWEGY